MTLVLGLLIAAAVCFLLDVLNVQRANAPRINWIALGLLFCVLSVIFK
jgi:hypothetical protein